MTAPVLAHARKVELMQRHMAALGVSPSTSAPPLWRLMWRAGLEVPPPLFLRFLPAASILGGFFGVSWGLLMWLLFWERHAMPVGAALVGALLAGACFGLVMAAYLRVQARRHRLPAWRDYAGAPDA